jgi:Na+/H+-dicarboxylate symporter
VRTIQSPLLVAFSTATSEAAYPLILEGLVRFGAPRRLASFVLPLGYSFNLDGSMMYCTFATMFIAQAYGIHLDLAQQVTMLAILMVTSKGLAGVPRASIVVIYATLPIFHLPLDGILLILSVDHLLDMGRSATNVVGNSVATVVVSRWEKQLGTGAAATVTAEPVAVTVGASRRSSSTEGASLRACS